jgi:hypothetical protein
MTYTAQMLMTCYSGPVDPNIVADAVNALSDCAQACTVDVDADLGASNVSGMVRCVRLCLHCADVCSTTSRNLCRPAEYQAQVTVPLLEACLAICKACADECEEHAELHEHCRFCAEACRSCERQCRKLLLALK